MLGGLLTATQQGAYYQRTYTALSNHNMIHFTLDIWALDDWTTTLINSDRFQLQFDNTLVDGVNFVNSAFTSNLCGSSLFNDLDTIKVYGRVSHAATSLTLRVIHMINKDSSIASIGFRNIQLQFMNNTSESSNSSLCVISSVSMPGYQCSCPEGQYENPAGSNTCVACNSSCSSCFGPFGKQCYQCATGYIFNGVECIKCDPSCSFCYGTTNAQCTACTAGYWLFNNSTCVSACDFPLVQTFNGSQNFCQSPCNSTAFVLWDGNCSSSCESPLQSAQLLTTISLCQYPCSASQYLYWNGTCSSICSTPLIQQTYHTRNFCTYPCAQNQYAYWNGSCLSTCASPFVQTMEGNRSFCIYPCASAEFLCWNGTCSSSCLSPLAQRVENGSQYCDFPCSSSEYLYWNGTCASTCPSPLKSHTDGSPSRKFCKYPCHDGEYLYQNSSCLSNCTFPFVLQVQSAKNFCRTPCADVSYAVYMNGSCTSVCTIPFIKYVSDNVNVCKSICSEGEYLYTNGSCSADCKSPYVQTNDSNSNYCNYPCNTKEFLITNGSCLSECKSPMLMKKENYGNICVSPCANASNYYHEETRECNQSCDYGSIDKHQGLYLECVLSNQSIEASNSSMVTNTSVTSTETTKIPYLGLFKHLEYIRYLNIQLPSNLEVIAQNDPGNILFSVFNQEMPTKIQSKFPKSQLPAVFEKRNLHPRFLVNFWSTLTSLAIAISIGLVFALPQKIAQRYSWIFIEAFCERIKELIFWNLCTMIIIVNTGEIILYSVLEFQTFHLSHGLAVISLLISVSMITLVSGVFIKMYLTIKKSRIQQVVPVTSKASVKDPVKKWYSFYIATQGFNRTTMVNKYFFLIYALRLCIPMILTCCLLKFPIIQTIAHVLISFIVLSYIIFKRPIYKKTNHIQLTLIEVVALVANVSMFAITIVSVNENQNQSLGNFLGEVIVIGDIFVNLLLIIMLFVKVIVEAIAIYKAQKQLTSPKDKIAYLYLLTPILQQGGFGFEEVLSSEYQIRIVQSSRKVGVVSTKDRRSSYLASNTITLNTESPIMTEGDNEDKLQAVIATESHVFEQDINIPLRSKRSVKFFQRRQLTIDIDNKTISVEENSTAQSPKDTDYSSDSTSCNMTFVASPSNNQKAGQSKPSKFKPSKTHTKNLEDDVLPENLEKILGNDNCENTEGNKDTSGLSNEQVLNNTENEIQQRIFRPRILNKDRSRSLVEQVYGSIRVRSYNAAENKSSVEEVEKADDIMKKSVATIYHLNKKEKISSTVETDGLDPRSLEIGNARTIATILNLKSKGRLSPF